ncbi:unnamed protein product [Trichobilharzia szidati]|nr:unnamed protein product [Trichobilharzia szidati]
MWNKVASDILKTPSFKSNLDKRINTDIMSMIKLLPSYEKLLNSLKEKLQHTINSCQTDDYENLIRTLLHHSMENIQSLDEYPELSLLLNSSSSLSVNEISELCNRLAIESMNFQGNKEDGDGDKCLSKWKHFHLCSSRPNSSPSSETTGGSSLTLCAKSSSTSSSSSSSPSRHGYASSKGIKQKSNEEVKHNIKQSFKQKAFNEQYLRNSVEDDDFQCRNSLSNMQNSIYSFSDADSSFSGYFNNVGFTVMNQDQLISLASALDSRSSRLDCRQKALKQLVHLPIIDIQACEVWTYLNDHATATANDNSSLLLKRDNSSSLIDTPTSHKLPNTSKFKKSGAVQRFITPDENLLSMHGDIGDYNDNSMNTTNNINSSSSNSRGNSIKMITAGGLRRGLADALNDEDDTLWSLSLRYISKGLSTTPPNIRETYSLLIEYLQVQFVRNAHQYPPLIDGIDFDESRNQRVLRACYLMNKFHQTIPSYWIRYSEQFVNEIIEKCLAILCIGCDQYNHDQNNNEQLCIMPIHLFSLVDCDAKWCIQSTHGAYCCNALISQLKRNSALFEFSVRVCLMYMNKPANSVTSKNLLASKQGNNHKNYYSYEELVYASFLHSIHLICRVICFSHGRNLFPIVLKCKNTAATTTAATSNNTTGTVNSDQFVVTVNVFLCTMLQFLYKNTFTTEDIHLSQHPFTVMKNCLTKLATYESVCKNCFGSITSLEKSEKLQSCSIRHQQSSLSSSFDSEDQIFIRLLVQYLSECLSYTDTKLQPVFVCKLEALIEILYNILSHRTGQIMCQNLISEPLNLIENLLNFALKLLNTSTKTIKTCNANDQSSQHHHRLLNVVIKVIHCGQYVIRRSTNLHFDSVHQFNAMLVSAWHQIVNLQSTSNVDPKLDDSTWGEFLSNLKDCLIHSLGYPVGIESLSSANLLTRCIDYLQKYLTSQCNISFIRPHTFGYLLSQLALNKSSLLGLHNSHIIELLVRQAWKSIEYFECTGHTELTGNYSSMQRTFHPPIWSIDPIDKIAYKPFINLVRVTTSYEFIQTLMTTAQLITNKESYNSVTDIPTNISGFLDRVVFINNVPKLQSLFNPEQCQLFGLRLLSCIISCLDSLLWFEAHCNLSNFLLSYQSEKRASDTSSNVVFDALTIERNYLLVKIFFIGGPNERELPPRVLCQHTNRLYPYPILRNKPAYNDHVFHDSYSVNNKTVKKCEQSPCKNWYTELFKVPLPLLICDLLPSDQLMLKDTITSYETAVEWMNKCHNIFKTSKTTVSRDQKNIQEKTKDVGDYLNQCLLAMSYLPESNTNLQPLPKVNEDDVKKFPLSKMDEIAIDWTIRYGQRIGLLQRSQSNYSEDYKYFYEQLHILMRTVRLSFQKEDQSPSRQRDQDEPFDWFVATIFLIYNTNYKSAWNFLSSFSKLPHSLYLWPNRCKHTKFRDVFYLKSCQYFEHLLAIECSNIFSVFVMSEISPVQIYLRWTNQCYWNYFDWFNILNYLSVCLLNPVQFQIYVNISIIKHLGPALLQATNEQPTSQEQQQEQLLIFLQEEPIRGFDYIKYLSYMYQLDQKYTKQLKNMNECTNDDAQSNQ